MSTLFKQFIGFHDGTLNRLVHLAGFIILGVGIIEKSLPLVLTGGATQELGHFYQYAKTKKLKDSPWSGVKSQSIFAIPLFILIVLYVVLEK